ncbi:iron chelate uptake ABC transporter family permease subunit [Corynebacterium mendelii]|uniref:Iron chelate uptake ABC transporter family permease subunit n=1 Tax=Corynebacterium mendelii TaxID=2765362 RepID=A0A939E007_9CORY|nr:iron chelate uptake ABC transporter family permease subunit [Corynebacterium mendelii]
MAALILLCAAAAAAVVSSLTVSGADAVANLSSVVAGTQGSGPSAVAAYTLPRTVVAAAAGAALGVAGLLMSCHTGNILADPGLVGTSPAAGCAVAVTAAWCGVLPVPAAMGVAAAAAGVALLGVVWLMSLGANSYHPLSLVVGGLGVALVSAAATGLVAVARHEPSVVISAWQARPSGAYTRQDAATIAAVTLVVILAAALSARQLNAIAAGHDVAAQRGINVTAARVVGLGLAAVLTGIATAAAGPVIFGGLLVAYPLYRFVGHDHRWLVPLAALGGAGLGLAADTAGRMITHPVDYPAAMVLVLAGAPLALALVIGRKQVTP